MPIGVGIGTTSLDSVAAGLDRVADLLVALARDESNLGDGGDAGESLAAKAERSDRPEVARAVQLAGGVAHQGPGQLGRGDTVAVVSDDDPRDSAVVDPHVDAPGARVERVLDELFDNGGGALDHLTGGDLPDRHRIEQANPRRYR